MAELGKAYIEVRADLAKFPQELRTKLIAALKEALNGVEFTELSSKAERAGEDAADKVSKGFDSQADKKIKKSGEKAGRSFLAGLKSVFTGGESAGLLSSLGNALSSAAGAAASAARAGGAGIGNGAQALSNGAQHLAERTTAALVEGFQQIAGILEDALAQLAAGGGGFLSGLQEQLEGLLEGRFEQVKELFKSLFERGKVAFEGLREHGRALFERLTSEDSRAFFRNLLNNGRTFFRDLGNNGRTFFTNMFNRGRTFFRDLETRHGSSFFGRLLTRGRGFFSSMSSSVAGFATRFAARFGSAISDAATQAQSAFSKVFSQLSTAVSGIAGAIGPILPALGTAIVIPVILLLVGAITQLSAALFALPAAAGVAVAAIAPLMIAMSGVSEAVSAGLSGDVEAFNKALEGLAPSARKVVKEIVGFGPALKAIKANTQQNFFAPLVGSLAPLGRVLLPEVNKGMSLVATQLGKVAAGFAELIGSNDIVEVIGDVFESAGRVVARVGPSIVDLVGVIFGVTEKGLPFVERFFGGFADGLDKLTGFLSNIQQNGDLQKWLGKAGSILGDIIRLSKALGDYYITLFGGKIGDAGAGFVSDLADKIRELADFLKEPQGQEFINNLATGLKAIGKIIVFVMGILPILMVTINGFVQAIRYVGQALEWIGRAAVTAALAIAAFTVWVSKGIAKGFMIAYHAVIDFFVDLGRIVADFFTETVPKAFDTVITFFKELPGKAVSAGGSLKDALTGWIKGALKGMLDAVLFGIGVAIGLFLAFPGLVVAAVRKLPELLAAVWDEIWSFAVNSFTSGRDLVVDAVEAIPGLLAAAGSAIAGFFVALWDGIVATVLAVPGLLGEAASAIGTFFSDLWNGVVTDSYNAVVGGVNSVVDYIASIPGKIAALGPRILDAARGIGRKIADGLSEIGNFATDLGKKVTNSLRSSINYIIGGINDGIAAVDDKLPGTLPRIPKLARGAVIDRPTLALVGEAGREVVMPLNDPRRAQQLADESGLYNLLQTGKPGATVNVTVYLDPYGVIVPITRTVVDSALDAQGSEFAFGTRDA